jgi:aldehyde dehydrogenase (NAD+)
MKTIKTTSCEGKRPPCIQLSISLEKKAPAREDVFSHEDTTGNPQSIDKLLQSQKEFFQSGKTLPIEFRIAMLKKLYYTVKRYEKEICEALKKDLGKSRFESYMCEIGMVLSEISYMIRHTGKFAAKKYVRTPLPQFAAVSYQLPTPRGNVLIMSPWNYPLLLTLGPLANAIAAGNTAIVKPSAYSPATSELVASIIGEAFPDQYIAVITGGRKENAELLEKKFDFIFFTGSQNVGKEVLRKSAEHLTPVVLELGGKSPCIVDSTAKIKLAAKRIVFGKYLNCGQTCVAPDYILCQNSIKDLLIKEIKRQIVLQYGKKPLENKNYGKIISEKHWTRLHTLMDSEKVIFGGKAKEETLQIEPTVLDNVTWDDAIMQEEIFGPLLPILTFETFEDIFSMLMDKAKPLALYLFTEDKSHIKAVTTRLSYGGGCINDTIIHLATSEMGFGGVGESGMGTYHGKAGFDVFSHTKSIVDKKTWMDLPLRYQPYRFLEEKLLHLFLK